MTAVRHRSDRWDVADVLGLVCVTFVVVAVVLGVLAGLARVMEAPVVLVAASLAGISAIVFGHRAWGRPLVGASLPTVVVVATVVVFVGLSAAHSGEHVLTDRDPGVYVTSARQLVNSGSLVLEAPSGGFTGLAGLAAAAQGYYTSDAGDVYSQFPHGLAVMLALGRWIGGDRLLFDSVALLAGAALWMFFLFARAVTRPLPAVSGTMALSVGLVTVHLARDAYSETLFAVLFFGGLWLLARAMAQRGQALSWLAGITLGATALVRIDAWVPLAGVVAFLFLDLWQHDSDSARRLRRFTLPVALGLVVTGSLGFLDLILASPVYLWDLRRNLLWMGMLVLAVLALGTVGTVFRGLRPGEWPSPVRRGAAFGVSGLIVVGAFALFFLRPELGVVRGASADIIEFLQRLEGVPEDATRSYWELSLRWVSWYIGIPALILGVAGWALAARDVVLGRRLRLQAFVLAFSITAVAYLWRPGITPDHLFAMRRYLPVVIPGMLLLAMVAIWRIGALVRIRFGAGASALSILLLVAAVVIPATVVTAPLLRSTTEVGMYGVTRELCDVLPDDAVVLITEPALGSTFLPAVRAFCEVPVVRVVDSVPAETAASAAAAWAAEDQRLFLLAGAPIAHRGCPVRPLQAVQIWYPEPERTLLAPPRASVELPFGYTLHEYGAIDHLAPREWEACVG